MENDKGQEKPIEEQEKEPKTPPGKIPVSLLLSSPIEQALVADPVVVMPALGDSPVNYELDDTIPYISPTTPTFLSPDDSNKENTPNFGLPTIPWSREYEHRLNRFAQRSPMYSPAPIQYHNYSSPVKISPIPFTLPVSPEPLDGSVSPIAPRRITTFEELKEEAGIQKSVEIGDLLGNHTPMFDSVADAIMEELQTNPDAVPGKKVSPRGRRIIVEDIGPDDADMMDLDENSDEESEVTPPKVPPKTGIFPHLQASPRNLRITVVTPKSTPAKKRIPLSPLTTSGPRKGKYATVLGKKFTIAAKKAVKNVHIPQPSFNVFVDPELRPVPQRSDYPDLATITSMKRSTQEAGFDTAHLDAFNLYAVLVKHKGKALSDVARVVYGVMYAADANKENNADSFYHNMAHVNNFIKNLPTVFPHLLFYGTAQQFTLARLTAFPEVLVKMADEPLKVKFQQFGGRTHADTPRPAKKGDPLRRL